MVRAAVEALGGIQRWVKPGHKVVIKPNASWARGPLTGATTNPLVVGETVRLCVKAGARRVFVIDRTCDDVFECYRASGIGEAVTAAGGEIIYVGKTDLEKGFRLVRFPEGMKLKACGFHEVLFDADVFINVPVAKHHSIALLSLGIKNIMGVLGGKRSLLHDDLGSKLADIHRVFQPDLTILDAYRILLRNGPRGESTNDVMLKQCIVAGVDFVAVDAVAARFFGRSPEDICYIKSCAEAGLGNAHADDIHVEIVSTR